MGRNSDLTAARKAKKDEFYTWLPDIERELKHYREHFAGKTVLCNCDDPFESDFFKYFALKFNKLKLKRLISTSWAGSPIAGKSLKLPGRGACKAVVDVVRDADGNGTLDLKDIRILFETRENRLEPLEGDGDFASPECLELLDQSDIVVTNPPFSLFRKYVGTLMERGKKFLIIGNVNAATYKEIFPLFRENKIWFGSNDGGGTLPFYVPDEYPLTGSSCGVGIDESTGRKRNFICVKGIRWFTNLKVKRLQEELTLVRRYSPERYPEFDHYDAIEVGQVKDIPCDYAGVMAVPITFLDRYNPAQFKIVDANGCRKSDSVPYKAHGLIKDGDGTVGGVAKYVRICIRNLHPEQPKEAA
ncbi:MAG: adenine-specific methyltransferase EcoRI family protein [Desulfovibrio sp.]|nr:adenine-specific methyltransferase EcoRI family protein [Desulfovibrio sp.]